MTTIHHPEHLLDRVAMVAMRLMMASMKGSVTGPAARTSFDALMEKIAAASDVEYELAKVGGVAGWWCRPQGSGGDTAILYLHGGAYVVGSAHAYRHFAGQLASRVGAAIFVPDYGLAPEQPFPAAIDQVRAAYAGLVASGVTRIALAGDSAGGGLALALLSAAVANPAAIQPVAAAVMSPWTDLALSGASMQTRADIDPLSTEESLRITAALYLGAHDARDPLASPLYADLAGLPPIRIDVGDDEILLDDSVRYGERVEQQAGRVEVHIWKGMVHVFPSNIALLTASKEALDDIGAFLAQHLAVRAAPRGDIR